MPIEYDNHTINATTTNKNPEKKKEEGGILSTIASIADVVSSIF